MKRFLILLLILIVSGCANVNQDITEALNNVFAQDMKTTVYYPDNYTNLMEYYVPSDLQEVDSNEFSVQLKYNDSSLVMNVNVAGIITNKYYESTKGSESLFDSAKLVYSKQGTYTDSDSKSFSYHANIYCYDNDYLIDFSSRNIVLYGYCNENDLVPVCNKMLILAKGVYVREDTIVSTYSTKEVIDYQKKQIDLFESVLPVNGRIDEMLANKQEPAEGKDNTNQ